MSNKRYYIVRDECDRLIAIFVDLDDCLNFVEPPLYYTELVI